MLFNVRRDMNWLDISECQTSLLAPLNEGTQGTHVSHAGILISDIGREELNEAAARSLSRPYDQRRQR
jgi:hypothetical protein